VLTRVEMHLPVDNEDVASGETFTLRPELSADAWEFAAKLGVSY